MIKNRVPGKVQDSSASPARRMRAAPEGAFFRSFSGIYS